MKKQDPRLQHTRQSIIDAFYALAKQKSFEQISIGDIAEEAKINRSTFYYHFTDKFDLIDAIQKEVITNKVFKEIEEQESINEKTIIIILEAIIHSQTGLSLSCQRAYDAFKPKVESEIKKHLTQSLHLLLTKQYGEHPNHFVTATFWSWGIYGVATACIQGEESLHSAVPKLMNIIKPNSHININLK
ncbi:TetR/AcrR family transcriptional regulator [Lysinibacillus sp. NPDC097162]|uniref:TetR/AcrR family transcriptional regulator n=1 Tax=Lysinibacillus sp. NPDC097162 TaxID=3364140 RepID=UPI0038201BFF